MSDPDLNHVSDCFPDKDETVTGRELKRQVYGAVRAGKLSIDAQHSAQASIPKKSGSENLKEDELIVNFPDRFQIDRQLRWNHWSNNTHRTNNIPEAFHSKVKRSFGHPHSSLHHFLHFIQELQSATK